ncbi:hypothetical protein TcarDRAFT_1272 [Thermosinus carboxydivorans Nor1]|uniref:HTH cro/C1-type domain-containing protein n=1 Tax=Thermosinus carboxydivorans Nor1 TaxID=401526 RepID=A1HR33_9FIRM|nr:helix-turn-helix transcriptional regulator [Thermosinus carboxydivorans]EAX47537.1 hypothetical protein TcarDRAFT_1272 [Thermosinus carboxydivorans Nor1]
MFKEARKAAGLSQAEAHFKTGIALKRLQRIESGAELPLPGEVSLLDKTYGANRMLVLRYCGGRCPDGQYAGLQFENVSPQTVGIKLISSLAGIEKLLPEIANIVCEACDGIYRPENRDKYVSICQLLSQLRRYIMAIEVLMLAERLPQFQDTKKVREMLAYLKEKTACNSRR